MAAKDIEFACIRLTQPIGTFYVGGVPAADVLAIAYSDIHRIEERDIERIVGIERELNKKRVTRIQQYVTNIDATFPTSVILAIDSEHATFDEKRQTMKIVRAPQIAKIIDGQHRIKGLEGFAEHFDLNVTIFIDMEVEDQAMTFATINLEQTKVNRSLVYDLYEFQTKRSPQKTCHNIARLLNAEPESPLSGRIKILGKATGERFEFITQAAFVSKLMDYVSDDPMKDRDLIKRGKKVPSASGRHETKLIFRELFIQDRDVEIASIVWNFFTAVAQRWPTAWHSRERGEILNRTQGFAALMRFVGPVYRAKGRDGKLSVAAVRKILESIKLRDSHFSTENYSPGTSGESALFHDFRNQSGLE